MKSHHLAPYDLIRQIYILMVYFLKFYSSIPWLDVMNPRIECGGLQSGHAPTCEPWT